MNGCWRNRPAGPSSRRAFALGGAETAAAKCAPDRPSCRSHFGDHRTMKNFGDGWMRVAQGGPRGSIDAGLRGAKMMTKDNVIEFRKQTAVTVHVHEDAERYTLEIEFKPNPPDLPETSE